jgi:tetratricopeptide (TPR) repeat protein
MKMEFNPENKIVKLCAEGLKAEGEGQPEEARKLFMEAWEHATTDFEKFTAAHFVARHQSTPANKLKWDKIALEKALNIDDISVKGSYPSLYLNIGKCYEDMGDLVGANNNYEKAFSHLEFLPDDGYGRMIRSGITNGLQRSKLSVHSGA